MTFRYIPAQDEDLITILLIWMCLLRSWRGKLATRSLSPWDDVSVFTAFLDVLIGPFFALSTFDVILKRNIQWILSTVSMGVNSGTWATQVMLSFPCCGQNIPPLLTRDYVFVLVYLMQARIRAKWNGNKTCPLLVILLCKYRWVGQRKGFL